jgi:transposase-like protein
MGRPSRFTPEEKLQIVLRHLRGETLASLHRELGIGTSNLKLWKKIALAAALKRFQHPIETNPSAITQMRGVLDRIVAETKDWRPEI